MDESGVAFWVRQMKYIKLVATEHLFGLGTENPASEGCSTHEQPPLLAQDTRRVKSGLSTLTFAHEAYPGLYQLD